MTAQSTTRARFITGSTMRHVIIMTFTGALGLMAMFTVDLLDLLFLSLLDDTAIKAAIGYAGTLAFINLSLTIGAGIASVTLVSRALGAGNIEQARFYASSSFLFSVIISAIFTGFTGIFSGTILRLLGASGDALHLAQIFIWTLMPGFVLLAGAVSCSFTLRGLGDAKRAMYITLLAAIITIVLDPLFIFVFGWGIQGAAVANVLADLGAFAIGVYSIAKIHRFFVPFHLRILKHDMKDILTIAGPAILTQLATPFAAAYVTYVIAQFGDEVIAANAIISRIIPVAFGVIFSLSGAIGPIIGQNYGAKLFPRIKQTLNDALIFTAIYTAAISVLLFLFRNAIADIFMAEGQTLTLVLFFCTFIAISWAFAGAQFVSNAAFNSLGYPNLSTWLNWGKATLGTIPFALYGAKLAGAPGVLVGTALGSVLFGLISVLFAYRIVAKIEQTN